MRVKELLYNQVANETSEFDSGERGGKKRKKPCNCITLVEKRMQERKQNLSFDMDLEQIWVPDTKGLIISQSPIAALAQSQVSLLRIRHSPTSVLPGRRRIFFKNGPNSMASSTSQPNPSGAKRQKLEVRRRFQNLCLHLPTQTRDLTSPITSPQCVSSEDPLIAASRMHEENFNADPKPCHAAILTPRDDGKRHLECSCAKGSVETKVLDNQNWSSFDTNYNYCPDNFKLTDPSNRSQTLQCSRVNDRITSSKHGIEVLEADDENFVHKKLKLAWFYHAAVPFFQKRVIRRAKARRAYNNSCAKDGTKSDHHHHVLAQLNSSAAMEASVSSSHNEILNNPDIVLGAQLYLHSVPNILPDFQPAAQHPPPPQPFVRSKRSPKSRALPAKYNDSVLQRWKRGCRKNPF